jgi:hypothetical protein
VEQTEEASRRILAEQTPPCGVTGGRPLCLSLELERVQGGDGGRRERRRGRVAAAARGVRGKREAEKRYGVGNRMELYSLLMMASFGKRVGD